MCVPAAVLDRCKEHVERGLPVVYQSDMYQIMKHVWQSLISLYLPV
jgi:hypothetical protein